MLFKYHRHPFEPQTTPLAEALEAIDHFEKAIAHFDHAKR
jgi:hypothetical protein